MTERPWLKDDERGVTMTIRVTPGARKPVFILEMPLPRLKVRERAVEGAANKGVLSSLSDLLEIPKSRLSILRGERSREKIVHIDGLTAVQVEDRLCNRQSSHEETP